MIIDCVGCLHGTFPKLEGGDLLIVTGDITASDKIEQYLKFNEWLSKQEYTRKIVIAGNHDMLLQKGVACEIKTDLTYDIVPIIAHNAVYLQDSTHEFENLKIWGTPHSLTFQGINPKCTAFTGHEIDLEEYYQKIPDDIDILVSHTPFYGILDASRDNYLCGSRVLRDEVDRVRPRLFVCSHIHEQGGQMLLYKHRGPNTICVNCSIMDENYKMKNKAMRITL